jgi:erythromycin 12 hydroxylase
MGVTMTVETHTIPPSLDDGDRTLLPWLREMRDEQPLWRDEYGIWHVFRYADVTHAISDSQVFSSDVGRVLPIGEKLAEGNLTRTDPPRHHALRRLVGAAFSPKVVTGLAPRIAGVTRELLDATGGAAEFNLVSALAYPLPVTVIAELLGLPISDRELFRAWADRIFNRDTADPNDPEPARKIDEVLADMIAYLREYCADRRAKPRQDLISRLAAVEAGASPGFRPRHPFLHRPPAGPAGRQGRGGRTAGPLCRNPLGAEDIVRFL